MIIDLLSNMGKYGLLIPCYDKISEYLLGNNIKEMPVGKYSIIGNNAYLLIQEYQTEDEKDRYWEAHKKYIDIQIVLKGKERISYFPANRLVSNSKYSVENDVALFDKETEGINLDMDENMFCIFYPGDGHKPCCYMNFSESVKKAVIKIST